MSHVSNRVRAFFIALLIMALGMALIGCGGSGGKSNNSSSTSDQQDASSAPNEITFDTPFEFDDLTITIGSGVTATVLENQYSDHSGATIAALPITIVNNSDETHGLNMFYYKVYGPEGTQLDSISSYFMETDVAFAGDIRSGATQQTTMHILYTGPGDYYIEFSDFSEKVEVKLPISL